MRFEWICEECEKRYPTSDQAELCEARCQSVEKLKKALSDIEQFDLELHPGCYRAPDDMSRALQFYRDSTDAVAKRYYGEVTAEEEV